jgi:hypothetical protein
LYATIDRSEHTIRNMKGLGTLMRSTIYLLCVLCFVPGVFAQNGTGTINGLVGYSGGPVSGASVQVKNLETGVVYPAAAGLLGNYTLAQLPPGRYQLTAASFGFKPYERKDPVVVVAGATQKIDIPMGDFISLDTLGEDRISIGRIVLGRPAPPNGPTPRTPDGKPDFSGLWNSPLPGGGGAPESPDMLPWAEAVAKERVANNLKDTPSARCLPFTVGLIGGFVTRLVQSPDLLVSIIEYDIPGYRQIYLDGRPHPKDLELSWTGHSIGHWEGETLVIDTIGYNDKTWLSEASPHTTQLHLTTRLRRIDLGHLEIEATFEDPGALKKPWKTKGVATLSPTKEEISEFICNENNQDVEHLVDNKPGAGK